MIRSEILSPELLQNDDGKDLRKSLLELWDMFDTEHYKYDSNYFVENISAENKMKRLNRYLNGENRGIAAVFLENKIVGFCAYQTKKTAPVPLLRKRSSLEIHLIAVDSEYRRKGAAESLFERVKQLAEESGLDSIDCGIWEFNSRMINFTKKMGFKSISRKVSFML